MKLVPRFLRKRFEAVAERKKAIHEHNALRKRLIGAIVDNDIELLKEKAWDYIDTHIPPFKNEDGEYEYRNSTVNFEYLLDKCMLNNNLDAFKEIFQYSPTPNYVLNKLGKNISHNPPRTVLADAVDKGCEDIALYILSLPGIKVTDGLASLRTERRNGRNVLIDLSPLSIAMDQRMSTVVHRIIEVAEVNKASFEEDTDLLKPLAQKHGLNTFRVLDKMGLVPRV